MLTRAEFLMVYFILGLHRGKSLSTARLVPQRSQKVAMRPRFTTDLAGMCNLLYRKRPTAPPP